jgi:serine/threonine protein kinase
MHSQAMIHGDLKGVCLRTLVVVSTLSSPFLYIKANILINQNGNACLADFGLLTIVSDPTNPTASSSSAKGGTTRWMSPELLDPDQFGFKDSRPTKESDCYALGMVIYEVLSGQAPFTPYKDFIVMRKVTEGERPERPIGAEGAWFTDDLWAMLELCWVPQPESRPSIEAVLGCLERVSRVWRPPPPQMDDDVTMDEDDWDLTIVSDSSGMVYYFNPFHSVFRWWIVC